MFRMVPCVLFDPLQDSFGILLELNHNRAHKVNLYNTFCNHHKPIFPVMGCRGVKMRTKITQGFNCSANILHVQFFLLLVQLMKV
jgi:hypothetical protein